MTSDTTPTTTLTTLTTRKRQYIRLANTECPLLDPLWSTDSKWKRQVDAKDLKLENEAQSIYGCECFKTEGTALRGYCCIQHRPKKPRPKKPRWYTRGNSSSSDRSQELHQACTRCTRAIPNHSVQICYFCGVIYCPPCYTQLRKEYGINRFGDCKHARNCVYDSREHYNRGLAHCPLCIAQVPCSCCGHLLTLNRRKYDHSTSPTDVSESTSGGSNNNDDDENAAAACYEYRCSQGDQCGKCRTNMCNVFLVQTPLPTVLIHQVLDYLGSFYQDDPNWPPPGYNKWLDFWHYADYPASDYDD